MILYLSLSGRENLQIKNIMIYGGSDLAYISAKHLSKKYNVKLICEDLQKCEKFADELPNVMVLNGLGTDLDFLREEDLDSMDAFLALSNETEKNILASLAAKESGVKKTISQVENIDFVPLAHNMGLNTTINIKYLTANFIVNYIREGELLNFTSVEGLDAEVIEVEVKEGSNVLESQLKDLGFPNRWYCGGSY
ncbi:MAG: NAD-binding protein [Cytophagales bacterium]